MKIRAKNILIIKSKNLDKIWGSWALVFENIESLWTKLGRIYKIKIVCPTHLTPALKTEINKADIVIGQVPGQLFFECAKYINGFSRNRPKMIIYDFGHFSFAGKEFYPFRNLLNSNDVIIVSSDAQKNLGKLVIPQANIQACPLPLNLKPSYKLKYNKNRVFYYAGRISRDKNIDQLIKALLPLKKQHLHIFGTVDSDPKNKNYLNELKNICTQLKINNRVHFHGHVSNNKIDFFIKQHDPIFVSLSTNLHEHYGMAALHALQRGKIAVLTYWGGHTGFKKYFKNQIQYVLVKYTNQINLDSTLITKALRQALKMRSKKSKHYILSSKMLVNTFINAIESQQKNTLWNYSPWAKFLVLSSGIKVQKQIYQNQFDIYIKPHALAYGAVDE